MTVEDIKSTIVKRGICIYAEVTKYFVYICTADILYGTGDYEDPEEIAEDKKMQCFTVYYSNILNKNQVNASAGQYQNYESVIKAVECSEGFLSWLKEPT